MKNVLLLSVLFVFSLNTQAQHIQFENNGQSIAKKLPQPAPIPKLNLTLESPVNINSPKTIVDEINIGATRFQEQSLGSTGRRVAVHPDGKISATWHYGINQADGFPGRGSGYNHFDGTAWGAEPSSRLENDRSGYPCFTRTPNGLEVALSHKSIGTDMWALHTNTKMPDEDTWTESIIPSNVQGGIVWGKVAAGGPNGNTIHVIGISLSENFGGAPYEGMAQHLLYFRSTDNGENWDQQDVIIPGLDSMFYNDIGAESYNIYCNGETVAIATFDSWGDVAIFKSTDNGTNWTKTIVHDFPLDKYDGSGYTAADIPFDPNAPDSVTMFTCDDSGSVLVDDDGKVHVFFATVYVFAEGADRFLSLGSEGIAYWNEDEEMNEFEIIGSAIDMDGDSMITINGEYADLRYTNTNYTSFPNTSLDDDGNLYCVYTTLREDLVSFEYLTYRHIYLVKSSDNGKTWTTPSDLLDPTYNELYNFVEGMFPALPTRIGDQIDLIYVQDLRPGYTPDGGTNDEHLIKHVQYDKDSFEPITATHDIEQITGEIKLFPNPSSEFVSIQFELKNAADVTINIFDVLGKNVLHLNTQEMASGYQLFPLEIGDMLDGVYFVQLGVDDDFATKKLLVNK